MSRSKPVRESHVVFASTLLPGIHVVYVAHEIVALLRLKGTKATIERIKHGADDTGLGVFQRPPLGMTQPFDTIADAAGEAVSEWDRLRTAA